MSDASASMHSAGATGTGRKRTPTACHSVLFRRTRFFHKSRLSGHRAFSRTAVRLDAASAYVQSARLGRRPLHWRKKTVAAFTDARGPRNSICPRQTFPAPIESSDWLAAKFPADARASFRKSGARNQSSWPARPILRRGAAPAGSPKHLARNGGTSCARALRIPRGRLAVRHALVPQVRVRDRPVKLAGGASHHARWL